MFGYFVLEKLIDLINEFKALKEYSILGSSNNLLFILIPYLYISISSKYNQYRFTFLVIFTSPKGKTIDFSFMIERSSFNSF